MIILELLWKTIQEFAVQIDVFNLASTIVSSVLSTLISRYTDAGAKIKTFCLKPIGEEIRNFPIACNLI